MKVYFAGPEPHNLEKSNPPNILLSYYDIYLGKIPFRKKTWEIVKEQHESKQTGSKKSS